MLSWHPGWSNIQLQNLCEWSQHGQSAPPKKESSILSSQEQTLRLARSRGIDGMLTRNSDSTFEQRATFRHLADQAARQRNLEAIMVMASATAKRRRQAGRWTATG